MGTGPSSEKKSYRGVLLTLAGAQKGAARGAPAYSRFVNRRIGRYLAAGAHLAGATPNQVTAVSALHTFAAIGLLLAFPPSWWLGAVVAVLLVLGYAWDSADGQVARLTGRGSPAGEWLDHIVDAIKVVSLPLAVAIGFHRFTDLDAPVLLIFLLNAVISSVMFFAMILTEQLRRAHHMTSRAATAGRMPWLRSVLVLPTDYGVLCLLFFLYGSPSFFAVAYGAVTTASLLFLLAALPTWFREMKRLPAAGSPLS